MKNGDSVELGCVECGVQSLRVGGKRQIEGLLEGGSVTAYAY